MFPACALFAMWAARTVAEPEPPPDALLGSWPARATLAESGVAPFAVFTTEAWGNVSGGLETGEWWNSLLRFGVELDTAKLGWWRGGTFRAEVDWVENSRRRVCFNEYTGGFNPVSGIMAGEQLRVYNLFYRQSWREDAVVLKAGQIAVDDDFMRSEYAGTLLNSAFGAMPSQVGTPLASSCGNPPAFPIYSVAAPGVFLAVRPVEAFTTQLGLYYGRPGFDEWSNHGFGWASQHPAELGLFWENGYSYRIGGRAASVHLGLSYHTGPVDDFSGATTGEVPATTQTVPNYYLIQDLALVTDREGKTKLGLFARGGITPDPSRSLVSAYADGGVSWFGPLPGRPNDVAGAAVSCTWFGSDYRASGVSTGVAAAETTLEVTYKAQITRWLTLQADTQFLFNPAPNSASGNRETAVILGLRGEITF